MLKRLLSTGDADRAEAEMPRRRGRFSALRQAYDDWRFGRDIAAVMSALNRLSDRQLHIIGLAREGLYESVEEMILDAERQRALGREVIELLEAPSTAVDPRAEDDATSTEEARDLRAA